MGDLPRLPALRRSLSAVRLRDGKEISEDEHSGIDYVKIFLDDGKSLLRMTSCRLSLKAEVTRVTRPENNKKPHKNAVSKCGA